VVHDRADNWPSRKVIIKSKGNLPIPLVEVRTYKYAAIVYVGLDWQTTEIYRNSIGLLTYTSINKTIENVFAFLVGNLS
jgi:hypothetical protein